MTKRGWTSKQKSNADLRATLLVFYLFQVMGLFPDRYAAIVFGRFGLLNGGKTMTLEKLGKIHGVSRGRIRELLKIVFSRFSRVHYSKGLLIWKLNSPAPFRITHDAATHAHK